FEEALIGDDAEPSTVLEESSDTQGANWEEIVGADHASAFESALVQAESIGAMTVKQKVIGQDPIEESSDTQGAQWEEIVGDLEKPRDAAVAELLKRRNVAAPTVRRHHKPDKLRRWQIDFGPAFAPAGAVVDITATPQCLFRGQEINAIDTAST